MLKDIKDIKKRSFKDLKSPSPSQAQVDDKQEVEAPKKEAPDGKLPEPEKKKPEEKKPAAKKAGEKKSKPKKEDGNDGEVKSWYSKKPL